MNQRPRNARSLIDARPPDGDDPATKLGEIVPEDLAHGTVEAVLQQLDRLAIYLFPKTRMSPLRDLASHDQKVRKPWTFHSSLGCAVANLARYAQAGSTGASSALEEIDCVWGAAYTRAIDPICAPNLETLGHIHPLDVVMRAAHARHRIMAGEAVTVFDLIALSGEDEVILRRELVPSGYGTVRADAAHAWLGMLGVEGFRS
jgi:hypothetical protein